MRFILACFSLGLALLPAMVVADVASGPAAGTEIPPLEVEIVVGDKSGEKRDVAADRGEQATMYVFVHAERFDRPMARLLRTLDEAVKTPDAKTGIIAVWLTDDAAAAKTRLAAIQQSLQFAGTSLAVHPSLKDLPDGWALNTDAALTVVVATKNKVIANFAYVSANETVAGEIIAAWKKTSD